MVTVKHDRHTIHVTGWFWGNEKVFYNGKLVSSKFSASGGVHTFVVQEKDKKVQYDVENGAGFWKPYTIMRRNGKIIHSDK